MGINEQGQVAVIYARYSSHSQKEESIEQQVEECQGFAEREGLSVIEIYSDKAITGRKETRAAYQRMIRDAERHKFGVIIAYKSNRIGRNMLNALQFEERMDRHGVRILYVREEFGNTPAGRFAFRSMLNLNQFYSENMSEDITRGMRDNAVNCKVNNGRLPFGYCKGADGKYSIVPEEAEIIRAIYTKFLDGEQFVDIANELNSRGIRTRMGTTWGKSSFASILTNERYIGIYSWADVRVENGIPPIIEKEMFYKVQERLKTKKHAQGRHHETGDYILTGKLYCGKCGALMVGMSGTSGTGAKHYYYACQTVRGGGDCDKKSVRRDYIEDAVILHIRELLMSDDKIAWMVDTFMEYQQNTFESQQLKAAQDQLSAVQSEIQHTVDAIAQGLFTRSTKTKLESLEAEEDKQKREIEILTCNLRPQSRERVQYYFEKFRDGDFSDKGFRRSLVNQFIEAVYLYDDEMRITFGCTNDKEPLSFSIITESAQDSSGTVRASSGMSHQSRAKRTSYGSIYMIGSKFVMVCKIS
jgi:site-specific DNA recombinase